MTTQCEDFGSKCRGLFRAHNLTPQIAREFFMSAKSVVTGTLLAVALFASAAAGASTDREAEQLARYEQFAKPPVQDMPFWRMDGYESLGRDTVMVWTSVKDAWLIRVYEPCSDLPWANSIGLTSNMHRVSTKFDFVLARKSRCMIKSIQPVDYRAYQAAKRQEDAAKKASDK
jgi:hypothetical protein